MFVDADFKAYFCETSSIPPCAALRKVRNLSKVSEKEKKSRTVRVSRKDGRNTHKKIV